MKCECGFEFSDPRELRDCGVFVTWDGKRGIICPECGNAYVDGMLVNSPKLDCGMGGAPADEAESGKEQVE